MQLPPFGFPKMFAFQRVLQDERVMKQRAGICETKRALFQLTGNVYAAPN